MSNTRRLRALGVGAALLGLGTLVGLTGAELVLRAVVRPSSRHYVRKPFTRMVSNPRPPVINGIAGPSAFIINGDGIRGRPLTADPEYRILAIGGSTTELLYVDGPKSWPALVEGALGELYGRRLWVGNVGHSGANARDHVLHMKYLTAEYPGIDAVVMLVGVNDLLFALGNPKAYPMVPPTEPTAEMAQMSHAFEVAPGVDDDDRAEDPAYKRLALYRLLRQARYVVTARLTRRGLASQAPDGSDLAVQRRWRRTASVIDTMPDLRAALAEYRHDLEINDSIARARHIRLIYMTQPSLWRADNSPAERAQFWLGAADADFQRRAGSNYYSPRVLAAGMAAFNAVLLDVCRARRIECLDLAPFVPKTVAMFYDDIHFTDVGSSVVANAIAHFFRLTD